MKTLESHISEALKIGKNLKKFSVYSCRPKTSKELENIIKERISSQGNKCDLNDIDVSKINDMSFLFFGSKFTGDISKWNVSNVRIMNNMFSESSFNSDISEWDVSNVKDMWEMFSYSKFNQDISNWNIREDCDTEYMFIKCRIKEEYKPKSKI